MDRNTLEITEQSEVFEFANIRELVNQALKKDISSQETLHGLPSGFKMLDQVTGGFQNGNLYTIAVRPGMGKTAFLLSLANNLAIKNSFSIAIFSSERSNLKITNRLIESETGMSLDKLHKGKMKPSERDHMHSLINAIAKADIFIDDTPSLSIEELLKRSRQLKTVHKIDLIIVDYLQLLTTSITDTNSRDVQLSQIVSTIKEIAIQLDLPILLFSQIASSPNFLKKPSLGEVPAFLSEYSDSILFLHRSDLDYSSTNGRGKNTVEVIVAKGPQLKEPEVVPLIYIESIAKFTDFS